MESNNYTDQVDSSIHEIDSKIIPEHAEHVRWMRSPHAKSILGLVSFAESAVAPILTDPFLVAIILVDRAHWLRYTIITIFSSVAGGVLAYLLGALFFDVFGAWLIASLSLEELFATATVQLNEASFWFVFLGAVTPIPYKLVALASGFVFLPIWVFVVASILGRTFRYVIVGYLAYAFGPMAIRMFQHRINAIFIFLAGIAVAYVIWKVWL